MQSTTPLSHPSQTPSPVSAACPDRLAVTKQPRPCNALPLHGMGWPLAAKRRCTFHRPLAYRYEVWLGLPCSGRLMWVSHFGMDDGKVGEQAGREAGSRGLSGHF
jgi:hypothetical protein